MAFLRDLQGTKIVCGNSSFDHDDTFENLQEIRKELSRSIRILEARNRNSSLNGEVFYAAVNDSVYLSLYVRNNGQIECGFHDNEKKKIWRAVGEEYINTHKDKILNAISKLETRVKTFSKEYPLKYADEQKNAWLTCIVKEKHEKLDIEDRLRVEKEKKRRPWSHAPPRHRSRKHGNDIEL
jgi:hypothetical protein